MSAAVVILFALLVLATAAYFAFVLRVLSRLSPPAGAPETLVTWKGAHGFAILVAFMVANVAAFVFGSVFAGAAGYAHDSDIVVAVQIVATYVLNLPTLTAVFSIAARHGDPLGALGLKTAPLARSLAAGVGLFFLFLPLKFALSPIVDELWRAIPGTKPGVQEVAEMLTRAHLPLLVLMVMAAVVVAPVFEEMIFRAFLQKGLERSFGRWPAIVVTSVLFAAVHGSVPVGLQVLPLAFVMSIFYDRRRDLAASMVFHGLFNATSVALALLARQAGLDLPGRSS